jgi:hypothetical protein
VEPLPKTKKTPNLNSPKFILFAIQRKNPIFPQNKKHHLVTLFSVYLRDLPFSEMFPQKSQNPKNVSNSYPVGPFYPFLTVPIKGQPADSLI